LFHRLATKRGFSFVSFVSEAHIDSWFGVLMIMSNTIMGAESNRLGRSESEKSKLLHAPFAIIEANELCGESLR